MRNEYKKILNIKPRCYLNPSIKSNWGGSGRIQNPNELLLDLLRDPFHIQSDYLNQIDLKLLENGNFSFNNLCIYPYSPNSPNWDGKKVCLVQSREVLSFSEIDNFYYSILDFAFKLTSLLTLKLLTFQSRKELSEICRISLDRSIDYIFFKQYLMPYSLLSLNSRRDLKQYYSFIHKIFQKLIQLKSDPEEYLINTNEIWPLGDPISCTLEFGDQRHHDVLRSKIHKINLSLSELYFFDIVTLGKNVQDIDFRNDWPIKSLILDDLGNFLKKH